MPFMKGVEPIRNTLRYLRQGDTYLWHSVKILAICYSKHPKNSTSNQGARDYLFWHWAQLQYKNPNVQLVKLRGQSPFPYFHAVLEDGRDVFLDVDGLSRQEVQERVKYTLGKPRDVLEREAERTATIMNPAKFGAEHERECICEVQGQKPCPAAVAYPRHLRADWRWNPL